MRFAIHLAPPLVVAVLVTAALAFAPARHHARPIWPACAYRSAMYGRSPLTGTECWACHGQDLERAR